MGKRELELYIHIPFCVQKCAYCDFLSAPADAETRSGYVEALIREIRAAKSKYSGYRVSTVFLGGGTPSILEGDETARIFHALFQNFDIAADAEVTMEANPGHSDGGKSRDLEDIRSQPAEHRPAVCK